MDLADRYLQRLIIIFTKDSLGSANLKVMEGTSGRAEITTLVCGKMSV